MKNIKLFCGKPLIWWNLKALEQVIDIDTVVVATDCNEIKDVVESFKFSKVEVYDRLPENAIDTASTESVILEYLNQAALKKEDIFILVQATSVFTTSAHFKEALDLYHHESFDSLLTCALTHKFIWSADGKPLNYNHKDRPRRQDFDGTLIENGAFYINTVENILRDENRLSGKIGIYRMPEHTSLELDSMEDWVVAEALMGIKY